jgi:hypothetical protein
MSRWVVERLWCGDKLAWLGEDAVSGDRKPGMKVGSPTEGSWNTIRRLVSSLHLILNPPLRASHSEKAEWMSFVLSSFGNPVRERIRVTEAESPESDVAIDGDYDEKRV